ncbi:fungal-specific transcription factor domain-containing protein [Aspergillus coremiiformis]|uniref:Fungal-specific transcription factor domain-containing protein n=1 Tax=Aspergillus coremiiformis TaxID=138285 RepID=A0A5N6ZL12_9EURO|nr:fungal-specific transcription factor domain-containing protein [Aspergillus coremiiformis]
MVQCSGVAPCSYCARSRKSCIFSRPPRRTPLTRKNLDELEHRCLLLEMLLKKLNPDVEVESALRDIDTHENLAPPSSPDHIGFTRDVSAIPDRFEWSEASLVSPAAEPYQARKEGPDGMASLPRRQSDTGYLGTGSGSSLMEAISHLLPEQPTGTTDGIRRTRLKCDELARKDQSNRLLLARTLSDTVIIGRLIDAYFGSYNSSYPILHEPTFREQYAKRNQIHQRSSWHPIFYLVLSIGSWILGTEAEPDAYDFYAAARSHMSLRMLEVGSLLTVQAFLLMGNYLQKRDRPNTGYNCIGMAYRMALGLGLHRELPSGAKKDSLFHERRRVVWWIVYSFDSGFGLTTGRPVVASDAFIETRLPRNIDEAEYTMDSILPAPAAHATNSSALIAQSQLACISNLVFNELFSTASHTSFDMNLPRSIEQRLKVWKLSLPPYFSAHRVPDWFRGPRAVVLWKEQNLRTLCWWGSQRVCSAGSDQVEARNVCQYTAMETIQDITAFCAEHPDALHPGLSWYATYFLFQAVLVLSVFRLHKPTVDINDELWLASVSRAHDCLASLSKTSPPATRCLEVLERLHDHWQARPSPLPLSPLMTGALPGVTSSPTSTFPDVPPSAVAADPALQIFFEHTSFQMDPFEGLEGFPSTQELDFFDYLPPTA